MFVNPVNNFSISNAYRNNSQNNVNSNQSLPIMNQSLNADTVSFGDSHKRNPKKNAIKSLAIASVLSGAIPGGMVSCTPDYENNSSYNSSTTINLAEYHKHPLPPYPIIIFPGCSCNPDDKPSGGGCDCDPDKPGCDCDPDQSGCECDPDKPGCDCDPTPKPDDGCNCGGDDIDCDCVHNCKPDTIWMRDTIYIKEDIPPHFDMNDSIQEDVDDFEIPTEGNGNFFYRFTGENEYLSAEHNIIFNGFFSSEKKSSFIDRVIDKENPKDPKISYYRIDYSASPATGERVVQLYKPANGVHNLPDDKQTGEAGWRYAGQFIVKKGLSQENILQLAVKSIDNNLTTKYYKNEKRGPGNMYKEWELENGETPRTTIKDIKAYKMDIDDLK